MTIWERLFGTPEMTAKVLAEIDARQDEFCWMLDLLSDEQEVKCRNCPYDFDPYECEPRDMKYLDWLNQEVDE